jgi:3-hydroxy acid dehydrogenase/malonic semialdehyde reductase
MDTRAEQDRLNGKTILITGASSGIGRSTAYEFARVSRSGLRMILTARRLSLLHDIEKQITTDFGSRVTIISAQLDICNASDVKHFVSTLPEDFQNIDVLINNAYVSRMSQRREPSKSELKSCDAAGW